MRMFFRRRETKGGIKSNKAHLKPVKITNDIVKKLFIETYNMHFGYFFELDDNKLKTHFTDDYKGLFEAEKELSAEEVRTLSTAIIESGINNLNGWKVVVNGLPPTEDGTIVIEYASGKKVSLSFNGGHEPDGFWEAIGRIEKYIAELVDFTTEKLGENKG